MTTTIWKGAYYVWVLWFEIEESYLPLIHLEIIEELLLSDAHLVSSNIFLIDHLGFKIFSSLFKQQICWTIKYCEFVCFHSHEMFVIFQRDIF